MIKMSKEIKNYGSMLDQSFSLENFKKIFEIENRKGNFESEFYSEEFHRLSNELKGKRKEINKATSIN